MTDWLFEDVEARDHMLRGAYVRAADCAVRDVRSYTLPDGVATHAVILDRSICYPEGGGQPGDRARLLGGGGEWQVADTRKAKPPDARTTLLHVLVPGQAPPEVGAGVRMELDWERRYVHMRYHTMLHLVCAAMPGVYATGNAIDTDKARIDFDLSHETTPFDREGTEARINDLIAAALPVSTLWVDDDWLDAHPELVRTMSVAPPRGVGRLRVLRIGEASNTVDLQPCGGTHVRNTAEIGRVQITKVENKGKQNRRIVLRLVG